MPNNRIQYTVGIKADASEAQQVVNSLQQQLQKVANMNLHISVPNQELKEASEAARELQTHLKNAINTQTGQLDLSKFNQSLKASGQSLSTLSFNLLKAGSTGTEAFTQMASAIGSAQVPIRTVNKQLAEMATTLKNTVKWQLSSNLVHGLQGGLQSAIGYAKDLNGALNDIRVVTGQSVEQMAKFAQQANTAAKNLSTTTKDYTKAALIYYQQGDDDETVARKTEITTKAANVAFTASTKEMSDMLTAVWNSYQVGTDKLQDVVDVMAALGATTASSMEEISTAMSKVAATANVVGINYDKMSAMIATTASATRQSAEQIGTSWNTILARFSSLKLGETLEDGVSLSKYTKAIESIGVAVLDANGELRSMDDIVDDIGAKWQTMNETQKTALAQTVGGVRQYTQLTAFFENFDKYQENLKTAQGSSGALDEQAKIYSESWEAASKRVKASLEGIYQQLLDDRAFIGLTNGLEKIITGVSNLIKSFGGLKGVLLLIGTIATSVFEKQIGKTLTELPNKIRNLTASGRMKNFTEAQTNLTAQIDEAKQQGDLKKSQEIQLNGTMKIMQMNQQLMAQSKNMSQEQINAAQTAIDLYKMQINNVAELQAKQEQATESLDNYISSTQSDLQSTFFQILILEGKEYNEALKEVKEAQDEIITYKNESSGFDFNGTFNEAIELAKKYSEEISSAQSKIDQLNIHMQSFGRNFEHIGNDNKENAITVLQVEADKLKDKIGELGPEFQQFLENAKKSDDPNQIQENLTQALNVIQTKLAETGGKASLVREEIFKMLRDETAWGKEGKNIEGLRIRLDEYGKATVEAKEKNDNLKNSMNDWEAKLKSQEMTWGQLSTKITTSITAIYMMGNAWSGLSTTLSSNASAGEKFGKILTTLVTTIVTATRVQGLFKTLLGDSADKLTLTSIKTAIQTALNGGLAASFTAAGAAVKKFGLALLESPLMPFIVVLAALGAAIAGITAIINANKKAEEQRAKAAQETHDILKERVSTEQKEREELAKNYTAWQQAEEIRLKTGEATNDYTTATEAVLESLGLEADKVLLTAGRYDQLAIAIENANQKRMAQNYTDAKGTYNAAYANVQEYAKSYEGNNTFSGIAIGGYGNLFGWGWGQGSNWGLQGAGKSLKEQWNPANFGGMSYDDFYANVLGLKNRDYNGDDIVLNGANADAWIEFAENVRKANEQFGTGLTNLAAWKDIAEAAENIGGIVINAKEEMARAGGQNYLTSQYGSNPGEDILNNRNALNQQIKEYLINNENYDVDDETLDSLASSIVLAYITSLGASFAEAASNMQLSDLTEDALKKADIDEKFINVAKAILGESAEKVFGNVYNVDTLDTSGGGVKLANSMRAQELYMQGRADRTKAQAFYGDIETVQGMAGTFDKKEDNRKAAEQLFDDYYAALDYDNEEQRAKDKAAKIAVFFNSTAEAQKQMLEKMSADASKATEEMWKKSTQEIEEAQEGLATTAQNKTEALFKDNQGWRSWIQSAVNYDQESGLFTSKDTGEIYNLKDGTQEQIIAGYTQLYKEVLSYIEDKLGQGQLPAATKNLEKAKLEIQNCQAATNEWADSVNLVNEKYDDNVQTTEKTKNNLKNFNTLIGLTQKSSVDTADKWQVLADTIGVSVDKIKSDFDNSSEAEWLTNMQTNAKTEFDKLISQSEAERQKLTDQQIIDRGLQVVSDAEYIEAQQKLNQFLDSTSVNIYNDSIKDTVKSITEAKNALTLLSNINLDNLSADTTTQSYKNLKEAFEYAGKSYEEFLGNTDQISQLEELGEITETLHEKSIAGINEEIKAKKDELDMAATDEQKEKIRKEIEELQNQLSEEEIAAKKDRQDNRTKQMETLSKEQQKVIDNAKKMQSAWKGIKIEELPKQGTEAYKALAASLKEAGIELDDFIAKSQKEKINIKYDAIDKNIENQIAAEQANMDKANELALEAQAEGNKAEYDNYITQAQNAAATIASLNNDRYNNEEERIKSLQAYYETVYDRINKLAQTTKEEIQKDREAIASLLSEDILKSGALNSTQKNALSDDQVTSWNKAANAQERLVLATEWYKDTLIKEKEALEEIEVVQGKALKTLDTRDFWSQIKPGDFLNSLYDTNYSDELKGYLSKVYNDALKLDPNIKNLSGNALKDKLKEIISKSVEESNEEWEKVYEAMYNAVFSGYKQIGEENAAAAEKAAQDWINAFKTIADIRKSLLTDDYDSVGEKIFGSVESVIAAMNAAKGSYDTASELFLAWKNGILTADSFKLGNADEYASALRGGNYDKVIDQDGTMRKAEQIYDQILGAGSYDKMAESVGDNQEEIDKNVRMVVEPAIRSVLAAGGMSETDIKSNLDLYFSDIDDASQVAATAIETFAQKLNEASEAMGNYQIVDEIKQEAETAVKDLQSDQSVLNAAQGTLLKDESLTEFGQTDELIKILQERGQLGAGADASDITPEMLQTALDETAQKIQDLGNSAAIAMGAIESGGANAFTRDENGNFQAMQSMTYAQAEKNNITIPEEIINEYTNKVEEEIKTRIKNTGIEEGTREWAQKEAEIRKEVEDKIAEEVKVDIKSTSTERANKNVVGEELENAGKAVDTQAIQTMENYAKAIGLTNKEFQTLVFSLGKGIKSLDDFTKLTQEEQNQLLNLAMSVKKASNGWEGLQKAQKESFNILKKGQKDTYEYFETLSSVTANIKAIFGGAKVVTKEFVEAHLADIEKMANGDMDAAERIEAAVLEAQSILDGWDFHAEIKFDIDKDGVEDDLGTIGELLNNFGDEFADQEIGFEITADDEPAIEALNHLLEIGALTTDQMNAIFEEIGWLPEIDYEKVLVSQAQEHGVTGSVVVHIPGPNGETTEEVGDIQGYESPSAEAYIIVPTIKSAKKRGTGARSMPSTQRPRPTRQRASRPARQPRERREEPKEVREDDAASRQSEAKDKADIERYHQVNKQLEQQTMMLERINKLKSARYGGDYLKVLRQENEELRRQVKIQEEKYKEAQEYLAFDKKRLDQINQSVIKWWTEDGQKELSSTLSGLGLADIQVLYDEEGNLDYQNLMEQLTDRYNQYREQFMADPEVLGGTFKSFEEWLGSDLPKMISDYEDSLKNVQQYVNQILDTMNQLSANNAEIIKYKVQLVIEEIEFDKSWEDYVQKAWSDEIEHVADILQSQFNKIFGKDRFDAKGKATGGVLKAINTYMDELNKANKALKVYEKNKEKIDNFAATGMGADKITKMLGKEFINEADYATLIKEIRTNLLNELNNLEEYKQALETSYTNLLSLAEAEWQKYESIVNNNINIVDTFKEIAKLTGEAYRNDEEYRNWSKQMTDTQIAAYDQMIDESMQQYAVHQAQLDELMRKANGDLNNLTEEERKQYDQTLAKAQAAEQKKLEYVQKKLQALRTEYEESIDYILKRLQTAMLQGTGALSFEDLASDYEWYNEQQDRYLSSTKELYEVSKLNRSINQSIEDTTNQATKERLHALQSVIDKQAQLNKLTQYDVDQMNLQYQLALALDELENARMNKSVVRLTRDEYGNMGYQYTADEDQLNSAQQKYEDVLQQINDLAEKRVQELENAYVQTMNDYYTQARQIALEYADDEETRNQKLQELAERTGNRLQFINEQLAIANANLIQSNTAIFEHYDKETQKYVGTPEATSGINHTIDQLSSQWQKHQGLIEQSVADIVKEMQRYYDKAEETAEKTGTSMSKMAGELEKVTEQNNIATVSMGEVTDALAAQYDQLNEATEAWKDWSEVVEDAIDDAEKAIRKIGDTLEEMGVDDASALWGGRGYGGTGSGTGSSTQGGSSGGNIGGGGTNKVDTVKYSLKDLANDKYDGIPIRGDIKDGEIRGFKKAGDVITFSRMSGSYVWSHDLMGWINIAYLDKEMSSSANYSTTAELLSTAIAQYIIKNRDDLKQYKTGGSVDFTGPAWLDGTPSSPEYILNARQTDQMFDAIEAVSNLDINFVRDVFDTINMMTASTMSGLRSFMSPSIFNPIENNDSHNIEQHIEINAQFPDASDYTEIKSVFDTLVNTATQYAYRGQN